jgi:hypothetical protein
VNAAFIVNQNDAVVVDTLRENSLQTLKRPMQRRSGAPTTQRRAASRTDTSRGVG